jgi:hypothetical protein
MLLEAAGTFLVCIYEEGQRKSRNDFRVLGVPAEY